MHEGPIVLLFIKALVKGQVKSRLAAGVGSDAALELYERFVLDTIDKIGLLRIPFRTCFFPPHAEEAMRAWLGNEHDYSPQEGNDLGERMESAFARAFSEGYTRAVLIGSDIPELTTVMLSQALSSLDTHDAVLGPAADGGYYLIGFTSLTFQPAVFHGIAWGRNTVRTETLARLARSNLRVHLLAELNDVDTRDDLAAFFLRSRTAPGASPRTTAYLTEHENELFKV